MLSFGEKIRELRLAKKLPLRKVAAYLEIDPAILSKIERGKRKASRQHVKSLAKFYKTDLKELMIPWLSDKIVYEIEGEEYGVEALKVAEENITYKNFKKTDRKAIERKIKRFLKNEHRVNKAWIFGSFARGDDNAQSDIDILIEENKNCKFSYFDLADIQFKLEKILGRKIDIGFVSSIKKHAEETILNEAKLIYEV